uniref:Uncharacterized protein n=1 Tax=Globisporangium ultimum (strain ATCC 200006 / CBS 805.95 / DAOM BR144) TaxID=431595 RepID=K3WVD3_GLOUD
MEEEKCAGWAREDDGGAEVTLSIDAFKQEMFRSLREEGTVEMIRAQLRRKFIEKLQQYSAKNRVNEYASRVSMSSGEPMKQEEEKDGGNGDAKGISGVMTIENPGRTVWGQRTWSGDEKLVNGLLFDYFVKKDLEHTAAVFVPEIGGIRNYVATDTILQMMQLSPDQQGKFQEPEKSIEGRMLQYQREYDELCEKRMQEELERFKTMELAMVRVEERKKYEREADKLRASLLQEHRQRTERLQETERELELSFVAKRTQLEASLFETRQCLFQEMEKLRVKETQLQVKVETDFRNFAAETKRLQLWEENLRTQEANVDRLIAQSIREKEQELQLERSKLNHAMKFKEDELIERDAVLISEREITKNEKMQYKALRDEISKLEDKLSVRKIAVQY